ncbi:hypothetical protein [Paraburkholderia hospita]|jgi:hypothetical protein|uniref:hypothetical protein n=1 Tax=Paraburkholderia hospita TaxID=169430 RepID=UPI000271AE9C|nr:hypothetical protein [Paraburkholderia hospita]EUC12096.1 hypothetical protein PMI06_008875 [Burkholderia sp. BT03]SEI22632.1 hypothetical protein SAMN05192544_104421 [Paraburkholderia hospita]
MISQNSIAQRLSFPAYFDSADDEYPDSGDWVGRTAGQRDENWPDWYAEYMVCEQGGKDLPL